jgi:hypothetical protein
VQAALLRSHHPERLLVPEAYYQTYQPAYPGFLTIAIGSGTELWLVTSKQRPCRLIEIDLLEHITAKTKGNLFFRVIRRNNDRHGS